MPAWITSAYLLVGILLIVVVTILATYQVARHNRRPSTGVTSKVEAETTDVAIVPSTAISGTGYYNSTNRVLARRAREILDALQPGTSRAERQRLTAKLLEALETENSDLQQNYNYILRHVYETDLAVSKKESLVEQKKQQFLNLPNIRFHFVDKEQVESYYDDYFKEPTIQSLVSEITGQVDANVKASLPQIIESRIGSTDLTKWMSTIKLPDVTLNRKFLRYQKETIKNEQVTLGIEEVEIELSELNNFENVVQSLERRYGLVLEAEKLASTRERLREKAAGKTLDRLEKMTGWVLVDAKFRIDEAGDYYKCVYDHPVNAYLTPKSGHVTITVYLKKSLLEPQISGNYAQSAGRLIPLRTYGQVWAPIDRKAGVWDLQITPLAVY